MKQEQETEALKGQIKILIANASGGVDAETMANLIVEKTPEESLDSLFDFLSGDDWFDQIVFLVPEAQPHVNWFTIMRDTVLKLLTVDGDESITGESPDGDPGQSVAGESDSDISDTSDGDISPDS